MAGGHEAGRGTDEHAMHGGVPFARHPAARGVVAHLKRDPGVAGILDHAEILVFLIARLPRHDEARRRRSLGAGEPTQDELEETRAPGAMRDAAELAQEVRNFFAFEEDAVGKPVLRDAQ
jgi:hypothetical protein